MHISARPCTFPQASSWRINPCSFPPSGEARDMSRPRLASLLAAVLAFVRGEREAPLPPTRHPRRFRLD